MLQSWVHVLVQARDQPGQLLLRQIPLVFSLFSSSNIIRLRWISLNVTFFKFAELNSLNVYVLTNCSQLPIFYPPPCLDQTLVHHLSVSYRLLNFAVPHTWASKHKCWMCSSAASPGNRSSQQTYSCQISLVIFLCLASCPSKILLISACLLLYPIKEKPFSVWFWDTADFWDQSNLPNAIVFLSN